LCYLFFVKSSIVEDGRVRLERSPEFHAQRQQQVLTIRAKFLPAMAGAKGLRRWRLWWQMQQKIRHARPGSDSLWLG
jgi:hypothetical protein